MSHGQLLISPRQRSSLHVHHQCQPGYDRHIDAAGLDCDRDSVPNQDPVSLSPIAKDEL